MSKKTILVTGAAGFVGRHLLKHLQSRDYDIVAMVRENTDVAFLEQMGIRYIKADLRVKESLYPLFDKVDHVVHLATTMKGPWEEYEESTVNGTRRLLEITKEKGIQGFTFISSIAVYDVFSADNGVLTEGSKINDNNLSMYEKSKIQAEAQVQSFIHDGLAGVILRCGVIYGPGGALFPPRLGFASGKNKYLTIGSGLNRIPFVYVENLVEAIRLTIENPSSHGETFNIVDDQDIAQLEYLNMVKTHVNPSLKVCKIPYGVWLTFSQCVGVLLKLLKRPSPLRKVYLYQCRQQLTYSNRKAKNKLGWKPSQNSQSAMLTTMKWFKDQQTHHRIVDPKLARKTVLLKKPQNVALIGCGVIAKTHLQILNRIDGVNVVGLFDQNIQAAEALVKEFGRGKAYASLDDLLNNEKIDVVHILTPPQSRKEIAQKCAQKGCHLFLEKPMAMDSHDAKAILAAANEFNVKLCVGHNHLFDPPMIKARQLIIDGEVGKILSVESWYGFNLGANLTSRYMVPGAENHWSMQLPGQLYQNLISHPLSVLSDCMGRPQEIYAQTVSANVVKCMKSDELKVMLKSDHTVGNLTVSLAVNPRYQLLNIYGTNMCLYVDFLNKTMIKHATPKGIPKAISRALMSIVAGWVLITSTLRNVFKVLTKTFTYFDGTEILIKEFYRRLEDGGPMPVSGEEGVESMEIMDEIWSQINI
ncbi:MAG: NAD-dependent epimerase/dehydratase family protein [Candidatus Omnitrophica bacterium]|nr:NAD-dependent epimerase/dehydratase family protein [Candidatus Omnitrophota bacterium]